MQDPVNWQFPRPRETKTLFVRVRGCGEAMVTQGRLCKARLGITFACSFLHLSFAMLLILCLLQQPLIGAKPLHGYLALQANFESTWVALHPNVPCLRKRVANSWIEKCIRNPLLSFAEHRLPLFICALLVPEYVLAWAIRQYLSAREIANQDKGELESSG